ncbi:hypothetical protein C8R47DRAFT_1073268 [Mycena vitilis]|nr:hypothetical protein C8R47DRAFT_1073268 [Mycena vitilis]
MPRVNRTGIHPEKIDFLRRHGPQFRSALQAGPQAVSRFFAAITKRYFEIYGVKPLDVSWDPAEAFENEQDVSAAGSQARTLIVKTVKKKIKTWYRVQDPVWL